MFDRYVVPTYGRYPLTLVRGRGCRVWDAEGQEYLDLGAGIAVDLLGHASPVMTEALTQQAQTLVHTSNLYYIESQGELARFLVEAVGIAGKCFFCNSGGEANETLFKLVRKHGHDRGRHEIIAFEGAFHGRTLAAIAASGQAKIKAGFEPAVEGFCHVPFNDRDAVARAIGPKTVAVLVEPIQGEGGIHVAAPEFLRGLRELCDQHDLLLLFDEVQCGLGRTGDFCGYRSIAADVAPDAISWAKGLAGGFPMGAAWVRAPYADVLGPGSHGSTFGGTPLACAVALAVQETIRRENLAANAAGRGKHFLARLNDLAARQPMIKAVRGLGLMIGVELAIEHKVLVPALAKNGLLVIPAGSHVIRFLPALNVTDLEIDEAVTKLEQTLHELGD